MAADALNATVAIIGGGYAGMAAAVALTERGIPVEVFEASRSLGGRARATEIEGLTLDNGQHILVGAYSETLALMRKVVADPQRLLARQPMHLEYPGEIRIVAPDWPAPLHLAAALLGRNGLGWREKWAAVRLMDYLKKRRYLLERDEPVTTLLDRLSQPGRLRRYLWEPLCVATMNTPADSASAQVFAHVLRDTLGADKAASELLLPTTDLGQLLPEPAAAWIEARGSRLHRNVRIRQLSRTENGWQLDDLGTYSRVIIATAPYHARPLLEGIAGVEATTALLDGFAYEPIVTAWLQYPAGVGLSFPMLGHAGHYLQWLFDRHQLGGPSGLLAAVISARGRHEDLDAESLAAAIHGEITTMLPGTPPPIWSRVVVERRATFACTPDLRRPANSTPLEGLFLAGDYTTSDYPATIESAVRSGLAAAELACAIDLA